ncbi:MAG TPA: lysine--tRNA ligase [Candidatus Paceibacterota bacterium]|nr:lysine--tRNA ligase [Candidatus Paceibacterota bacterium]
MFWADRIAQEIQNRYSGDIKAGRPLIIRDEKTVSGRVHVGSMRGVAIHGAISEALKEQGAVNSFLYEFNDFDPMDDVPEYLPREVYEPYLGRPLRNIPPPEASAKNYAEYFANDFHAAIKHAGFDPKTYWGSELYLSGKMDGVIKEALEHAHIIRQIYKAVSGSVREEGWLPINVICPTCGKVTTTQATDFDGKSVKVHCVVNKVAYTKGCGYEGRIEPYGGTAKLPWKVEWAAKWKVNKVLVEGAGKDHSTRGGARDVANHISREVFHYEPPFDIPYEFLLVGGAKMSSSKGRGSGASEIAELLPTKVFRLALLHKDINQQFNFDPYGDTIPTLYDLYDKLAANFKSGVEDDYARLFTLAHVQPPAREETSDFLMRFSQVAFLVQMPHLILLKEAQALKGTPLTEIEKKEIEERARYARKWLDQYAPEKFIFKLQESLPNGSRELTKEQKEALRVLLKDLEIEYPEKGELMHTLLRAIPERPAIKLSPRDFFTAIYIIFLDKDSGPQAGWFLAALPKDFVLKRLREVAA